MFRQVNLARRVFRGNFDANGWRSRVRQVTGSDAVLGNFL